MNKKNALITVIAIFFIGMICGGLIVHIYHLSTEQHMYRGRQFMGRYMVEKLDKELNLSEAQKEKIFQILLQTRKKAVAELGKSRGILHNLFKNSRIQIKNILTPSQREKFDKIFQEHSPMRRRMFKRDNKEKTHRFGKRNRRHNTIPFNQK